MRTLSLTGDLKAAFQKMCGSGGTFNSYKWHQQEAWNLPNSTNANVDFTITPKMVCWTTVFLCGERKIFSRIHTVNNTPTTLESYFDANAHLGYKYNDRLTGLWELII
jgi:hypothetical protein